jgi:hypothetical protein
MLNLYGSINPDTSLKFAIAPSPTKWRKKAIAYCNLQLGMEIKSVREEA